jgi:hypothetical protein
MPNYQHFTDDELLNLAQQRDQLTQDASLAFDAELASRKLSHEEVQSYARKTAAQERAIERQKTRSRFFYETRNKKFLGKKNRYRDPRKRIEEFDTTLWLVAGIPLFPLSSYRVRRRFRSWLAPCPSRKLHLLETKQRDWEQILWTWVKTALLLLALCISAAVLTRRS